MYKYNNLIGKRFGRLLVIEKCEERKNGCIVWKCKCDCGNFKNVPSTYLLNGLTRSCGCLRVDSSKKRFKKDLTGMRFGRLTVIKESEKKSSKRTCWVCKCDCGNTAIVAVSNLLNGNTKSCGCIQKEKARKHMSILRPTQVNENHPNWRGGASKLPYCYKFNKKLKDNIRNNYGNVCFICGKTSEENGVELSVHHIDYNKNQGCDGHNWKLVPLCISCHAKTNHKRFIWNFLLRYKLAAQKAGCEI